MDETKAIPKQIVKEKSMQRKYLDGEIPYKEYEKYLIEYRKTHSQTNKDMETMFMKRETGKITNYRYHKYLIEKRHKPKEKTMYQKYKNKEISFKEYYDYLLLLGKPISMIYKYMAGEITSYEYKTYLAQKNGLNTPVEYDHLNTLKNGFKTDSERRNYQAQQRGFKDVREYNRYIKHKSGICKSQEENKECSNYLGIVVAEKRLSKIFETVTRMPTNFSGYDFICGKGHKIDSKSACLKKIKGRNDCGWGFGINRNTIADYFLLLAFDDRYSLNPLHIWLIKGTDLVGIHKPKPLNARGSFRIYNTERSLRYYEKYELTDKLEKLKKCCDTLKDKKVN